ncbi:hypothetical protein KP509_21G044400 [Ceratopteris richardii]|nr:hypothetical protein KP509_21G044400 [Ceratopteris richardii]
MRASADANELATLFAECAIREADATAPVGSSSQPVDEMLDDAFQSTGIDTRACSTGGGAPILAESGRLQVVLDASMDGSSFICLQCGGLVSNMRKDEHYAYWCSYSQST